MRKGIDYPGIAVVFACHDGEGNFLFSKRSIKCRDEHGTWDPGGGSVDLGETVLGTLAREIAEEYCTKIIHAAWLGYRDTHRILSGEKTHWISLDFIVYVDRSLVRNGEPDKADEVAWFRLNALPTPVHSQWPIFIDKYEDVLRNPPLR